jgi:hypothetical protein
LLFQYQTSYLNVKQICFEWAPEKFLGNGGDAALTGDPPRSPFIRKIQAKQDFLRRGFGLKRRAVDALNTPTPDIVVEIGSGLVNINPRNTETIMKNSKK